MEQAKGWKIKNCNLCKYYKFNYFSNYCTLYKVNNIGRKYLNQMKLQIAIDLN